MASKAKDKNVCVCGPFMYRQMKVFGPRSRTVEIHNTYCVKHFNVKKV